MAGARGRGGSDGDGTVLSSSTAHLFRKRGRAILYDPATRASFELDEAEEAAARRVFAPPGEAPEAAETADVSHARGRLADLRQQGCFRPVRPPREPLQPGRHYVIGFYTSHVCNLRCCYCCDVSRSAESGVQAPAVASRAVMDQAAEFIAARNARSCLSDLVVVGMGGEITLEWDRYDQFREILRAAGERHQVSLSTRPAVSNLTTTDRAEVSSRLGDLRMGFSLDGPSAVNDRCRTRPDGRGTYDDVRRGIERLRAIGAPLVVTSTVTAWHPDVSEVYFHLFDLGITDLHVDPVRADPRAPYAIGHNLDAICAGYDRLVDRLLALSDGDLLDRLLRIMGQPWTRDYLGRFLLRTFERLTSMWRCRAGISRLTIDTDGKLYACNALVGVEEACMGSVWDGIDEALVQEMAERLHITRRAPCRECWARFLCGGGCLHQSYLTHGEFEPPDPSECALNKHLIELALWTYWELKHARPEVLRALPQIIRAPWMSSSPSPCPAGEPDATPEREAASLAHGAPTAVLQPTSHLRRRIPDARDPHEVRIHLAWTPSHLSLLLTPCGAESERYWERVRHIEITLLAPRSAVRSDAAPLPPLVAELSYTVKADPADGQLRYGEEPWIERSGEPAPGSLIAVGRYGCLIRMPWPRPYLPRLEPGVELGLQVAIHDVGGGVVEWEPTRSGARIGPRAR